MHETCDRSAERHAAATSLTARSPRPSGGRARWGASSPAAGPRVAVPRFRVGRPDETHNRRRTGGVLIASLHRLGAIAVGSGRTVNPGSDSPGEIVGCLTQQGRDRRAFPRRDSDCLVAVCAKPLHACLTTQQISWRLHSSQLVGRLVDASMNGLALQLPEPVAAKTRVYLRIANRHLDQHVDADASVLRCTPAGDGVWNLICRLEKHLTFEQIHAIGKHLFAATIV